MTITPFKVTQDHPPIGTNGKLICDFLLVPTYLLSCIVSKLWPIIGQIFASDRGVPHLSPSRISRSVCLTVCPLRISR